MQKENNKYFVINIIAQIFILLANLGISFFLTPFIVSKLGSEMYGYVSLSQDFVNYAMILTVALNSMSGRFITVSLHQNKTDEANKYFTTIILANIIISIVLFVLGVFLVYFLDYLIDIPNNSITDVKILFIFILLNFLISLIGSTYGVATFSTNKLYLQSKRKIESYIIKIAILIICYTFFKPYILFVGVATMISTLYTVLMDFYYQKKLLPEICVKKEYFDFQKLRNVISSGVWSSISKLSNVLTSGLNLLISNKFVNSLMMGSLSVARTLPNMILSAFGLISSVFSPNLTIYYAKKDKKNLQREVTNSIKFLSAFSCIFITFLFVYGKEFFMLWVPQQDSEFLYWLSILSSFALVVALPMENFWNLFIAANKIKYSSMALITDAILSVLTMAILLFCFKFNDAQKMYIISGVSSVFSVILSAVFLPIYGAKCIDEKSTYFYPVLGKAMTVTGLSILIMFIFKTFYHVESWFQLIVSGCIICTVCFILDYLILFTKSEKQDIKNKLISCIKRRKNK